MPSQLNHIKPRLTSLCSVCVHGGIMFSQRLTNNRRGPNHVFKLCFKINYDHNVVHEEVKHQKTGLRHSR